MKIFHHLLYFVSTLVRNFFLSLQPATRPVVTQSVALTILSTLGIILRTYVSISNRILLSLVLVLKRCVIDEKGH